MKRGGLEAGLRSVLAGHLGFGDFVRLTESRWQQIADSLYARWDVPGWITREDMKREMVMTAWRFLWRFDARTTHRRKAFSKFSSIERFIVWNAIHQVVKSATKARIGRRPHRGEGKGMLSCYELPASSVLMHREEDDDEKTDIVETLAANPTPSLDEIVDRRVYFKRAAKLARGAQRIAFLALAVSSSAEEAAMTIYDNCEARFALRCNCEQDALDIVSQAVESLRFCPQIRGTCLHAIRRVASTRQCAMRFGSPTSWGQIKTECCASRVKRRSPGCVVIRKRTRKAA